MNEIMLRQDDLESLIMFLYPWGVEGGPLERFYGPREWQLGVIRQINDGVQENKRQIALGKEPTTIRIARASGRGPGKSALVGMLQPAIMSVVPGITSIISSNTEAQMKDITLPEVGKWHAMAINSHWFDKQSLSLTPKDWFKELLQRERGISSDYYYCRAKNWSEDNPDAYAGAHSTIGMFLTFDEASGIPSNIWTIARGYFTDISPWKIWLAFSQGRRNSGEFYEIFHRANSSWDVGHINALDVVGIDHAEHNLIIKDFGINSNEARVEVYGQFPESGGAQFMDLRAVDAAIQRVVQDDDSGLLMGVDVSRGGANSSVIAFRRGLDAASIPWVPCNYKDTTDLVYRLCTLFDKHNPSYIIIDAGGVGGPVYDRMKQLGYPVIGVEFGGGADQPERFYDKRAELYSRTRDWLEFASIPDVPLLRENLIGVMYAETENDYDKIKLMSKKKMAKLGVKSQDWSDALAMTHAVEASKMKRRRSYISPGTNHAPF